MKMLITRVRNLTLGVLVSALLYPGIAAATHNADHDLSAAVVDDYTSYPVISTESAPPKVMLVLGKDHQYFFKAYNDYSDLDGDGVVDTTYKHSFDYLGYFDHDFCYDYVSESFPGAGTVAHFKPIYETADKYCDNSPGQWSGNFLNWASMTRMDLIRLILYGGRRFEDHQDFTLLERTYIPTDAHSFAKHYRGDDLDRLTPFVHNTGSNINPAEYNSVADIGDSFTYTGGYSNGSGAAETVLAKDVGITICNTTLGRTAESNAAQSGTSQNNNQPPLMRITWGDFSLWAAGERYQCEWDGEHGGNRGVNNNIPAKSGIDAYDDSPRQTNGRVVNGFGPSFNVYVRVCTEGLFGSNNNHRCKQYPDQKAAAGGNDNGKPTGLINEYGEDERILFGMITGTFGNNTRGGVLRKNPGTLEDEINLDTDGTYKADPNSAVAAVGLIRTLDKFRLYGYRYGNDSAGTYFGGGSGDSCGFQLDSITNGTCVSWGNPITEMYVETLRYLAGQNTDNSSQFITNDSTFIGGLDEEDFEDPLDDTNFCTPLSTVVFNASINSYDSDELSGWTDITSDSLRTLTNEIGDVEGINGATWFVGRTDGSVAAAGAQGSASDEFCTPKAVGGFGDALGTCSEGPTLLGTYQGAGAAWYAHTKDIRPGLTGTQTVDTYAVALAPATPTIEVPLESGRKVIVLPAYRMLTIGDGSPRTGAGTLVDFRIVQEHTETVPGVSHIYTARYYVNWEDSEQGGDFDQDLWGTINYLLDSTGPHAAVDGDADVTNDFADSDGDGLYDLPACTAAECLTIVTEVHAESTAGQMLFGFITSGTTEDGFHAYSGIENAVYQDPNPGVPDCSDSPGDGNCDLGDGARFHTFIPGAAAAGLLENPLFYMAKWGGFNDENNNDKPDLQTEWDIKDTGGNLVVGGDGIPDNFFFVTDPRQLQTALKAVFDAIIEKTASGTAAAVVANSQNGVGAAFQALYETAKSDVLGNDVAWIGNLHALWIDSFGFLREDNPAGTPNGILEGYNTDPVVEVFFDAGDATTKIRRFTSDNSNVFVEASNTELDLEDISPIWSARDRLSALSDAQVASQRVYDTSAATGRYIITWIDADLDGAVDSTEVEDFDATGIDSTNFTWFDLGTEAEVDSLVSYLRGVEGLVGKRNRTVDLDGNSSAEAIRLGDIIDSTPTPVQAPSEAFDLLFGDLSFATFRTQYSTRRQVVYVGGNDGMLHAFNAGFFNAETNAFDLTRTAAAHEGGAPTAHPLGTELWAYVPKNLLHQLKFLQDPDYTHVYYVDGKPRVFDAKVFPADTKHPGGWGTVLVIPFRLGGAVDGVNAVKIDTGGTGLANDADDVQSLSGLAVLDVTDPEDPPIVIAEITHPDLAYATSFPAVVAFLTGGNNKWYLVFGSGPTDLETVTSGQSAKLFAYEMAAGGSTMELTLASGFPRTLDANSFIGDPVTVDWDLDGLADSIYFGSLSGIASTPGGKFYRLPMSENAAAGSWGAVATLISPTAPGQPFLPPPIAALDEKSQRWVITGTGRYFVNGDRTSTPTQTLYGFIENGPIASPNSAKFPLNRGAGTTMVDVTDVQVFVDGSITGAVLPSGSPPTSFNALRAAVETNGGWYLDFDDAGSAAQRNVAGSALVGGILFTPAFTPSEALCGSEGVSVLFGLDFRTGTASADPQVFGSTCTVDSGDAPCPPDKLEAVRTVTLGAGLASSPAIHAGRGTGLEDNKVTVVEQTSTGAIILEQASTVGGVQSAEISWREY